MLSFDLDPLSRHTIWALVIGGTFFTVQTAGVNQNMIQRYLSLPSLKQSKKLVYIFLISIIFAHDIFFKIKYIKFFKTCINKYLIKQT